MSQSTPEHLRGAGGSIVSRHVLDGRAPIRWAFREEQADPADNGWRFLSALDDQDYLDDPAHLVVVGYGTVVDIEPAVLPLLHLPVGTEVTIERAADGRVALLDSGTGAPLDL